MNIPVGKIVHTKVNEWYVSSDDMFCTLDCYFAN